MIATIELWKQAVGLLRVARHLVKINDHIEVADGGDPFVHSFPVGFALCAGMIVVRAAERQNRRAEGLDALGVRAGNHLLESAFDAFECRVEDGRRY